MFNNSRKGILIDKPLILWFFFEKDCPICAFVKDTVLRPMQHERIIEIERYEIRANNTSPAVKWFYDYCENEMAGDVLTPTIRLVDIYYRGYEYRIDSVKILHLWRMKPNIVGDEDKQKANQLRKHIMEAVANYRRWSVTSTHDVNVLSHMPLARRVI